MNKEQIKNIKGITLIALVVTIVVLLILAGVSISMLMGENGVIIQAQKSKTENEIGEEKEYINLAVNSTRTKNYSNGGDGKLNLYDLQKALDEIAGENRTEVSGSDRFTIVYLDSKRTYYLNENYTIVQEIESKETIFKYTSDGYITGVQLKYLDLEEIEKIPESNLNRYANIGQVDVAVSVPTSEKGYYLATLKEEVGTELEIPSEIEGTTIMGIDDYAFSSIVNLTKMRLPETVKSIGKGAFIGTALIEISIPNGVEYIGEYAFNDLFIETLADGEIYFGKVFYMYKGEMPENTDFTIRDGTKQICTYAFNGLSGLKNINIPDGVERIDREAFSNCTNLIKIKIPDTISNMDWDMAFYGCSSLNSIDIPDTITDLGEKAFYNCKSLKNIVLPENLKTTGKYTFYSCIALTSITIPQNLTTIGYGTFFRCTSLNNVNISANVTSIENLAFRECTSLKQIEIPDTVTEIGKEVFYLCSNLTNVKISKNIKNLEYYLFNSCSNLESIEIPKGVISIGGGVFEGCKKLVKIEIPEGVTKIDDSAFYECTSLKSVQIPESVTSIGGWAFASCTSLSNIIIPSGVIELEAYVFANWRSTQIINIKTSEKPEAWSVNWNKSCYAKVNWNYIGE